MATVLYIDDDLDDHELFLLAVNTLSDIKATILQAMDENQAVKLLAEHYREIDLIILDISFKKGKQGFQILREIRINARTRSIPVVMFTTSCLECDRLQSLEDGANRFIVKPNTFREICDIASSLLREFCRER